MQEWDKVTIPKFTGKCLFNQIKDRNIVPLAKQILHNNHLYFFYHHLPSKTLPDWFADPFEKKVFKKLNTAHWSKISNFEQKDIKCIWELSRFAWAYPLLRAYSLAGDESFSDAFWRLVEDWVQKNPPNKGVHWKCGQEIAIRMLAMVTGYFTLQFSEKTTDARKRMVQRMLYASTKRIEANIGYALSQKNNHGISEATGLFTGGVLFEDGGWVNKGRYLLERQVQELVYTDGSFSQHSANYHRVMLQACLWSIQLGRANGINFSEAFVEKIRKAGKWLLFLYDPKSGGMPNLGSNDGALILPYSICGFQDFRPTIQTVGAVVDGSRWLPAGPWDDMALWLVPGFEKCKYIKAKKIGIENLLHQKIGSRLKKRVLVQDVGGTVFRTAGICRHVEDLKPGPDTRFGPKDFFEMASKTHLKVLRQGGYAIITHKNTKMIFRCPAEFHHRPSQCDLLHLDLWRNGVNLLRDAGTYSYNCEQPWQNYFKSTAAHNTVQFDDHDQMPELSRFLYGKWPVLSVNAYESLSQIQASYTDWKGCYHRRSITPSKKGFKVIDSIAGGFDKAILRWRLAPEIIWTLDENICKADGISLKIDSSAKKTICLTVGWESLYYMNKKQLPVLETTVAKSCKEIITHIFID